MPKTCVIFETKPIQVLPDKDDLFADCPQVKSITYTRFFDIDPDQFGVVSPHNKIRFYGDEYQITSLGISHRKIGILVTEEELVQLLTKAKAAGQRWKKKPLRSIDARVVFQQAVHRMAMH
jgi:hypothetical protein